MGIAKISRYNIFVPLMDDRRLVYNAMSGALAVWERADVEAYQAVQDSRSADLDRAPYTDMANGGFIVPEEVDELAVLEKQYVGSRFDDTTMILTLMPTTACNFGCDYCFQGPDKPSDVMTPEVQDAVVRLVELASPRLRRLHVAWYGGEPLLKPDIIETLSDRIIEVCKRKGLRYDSLVVSNGWKLDKHLAKKLYDRGVETIQITLDGASDYHNKRRTLLSGKPTFDRILANIKEAVDATPIFVATRVNIDARNHQGVAGLIEHLSNAGLAHRKNFKVYFAPVEAMTEGCHVVADVCMGKKEYGQLEADLYRKGYDLGITSLPYPSRFMSNCVAARPKGFVVLPNGDLHKCWDTIATAEHKIGSIFELEKLPENEQLRAWLRWTPFVNDTCRNCKILPVCAGACAYKFVHADDTRGEAAVLPCPSWKYNIKERLVLHAEKRGNITALEYDEAAIHTNPGELCTEDVVPGRALPGKMAELARTAVR